MLVVSFFFFFIFALKKNVAQLNQPIIVANTQRSNELFLNFFLVQFYLYIQIQLTLSNRQIVTYILARELFFLIKNLDRVKNSFNNNINRTL